MISLIPQNPNTASGPSGWESENAGEMNCKEKNGKEFIKCMGDNSYALMNMTSDEEQLYVDNIYVMSKSLQMKPGDLTNDPTTTIRIAINDSLMYHIIISDPKVQWTLYESDTPQIYLDLLRLPYYPHSVGFYIKVYFDFNSYHFNFT